MYSILTGQLVRTLSTASSTAHAGRITRIHMNPANRFQLYSSSLDGTVKLWDTNDGALIKTWTLNQPVTHFVLDPTDPRTAYVALRSSSPDVKDGARKKGGRAKGQIAELKLNIGSSKQGVALKTITKARACVGLAATKSAVIVAYSKRFEVITLKDKEKFKFATKEPITSLALHPTDPCVAVGLNNGEIQIWYCLAHPENSNPVVTRMHWHAHGVTDLCFTPDGINMLSGGAEMVLVIWQVQSQHKSFLPRLGSEISAIGVSSDQSHYALSLADTSVRIISATSTEEVQNVSGLKAAASLTLQRKPEAGLSAAGRELAWSPPKRFRAPGITVDPRTGLLVVVSGKGDSIQFYNAAEDRHVMELETSPRNRISRTNGGDPAPSVEVSRIVFSATGAWMATVEVYPSPDGFDQNVRIWEYDASTQSYMVNTRLVSPHDDIITSACFSPDAQATFLTCSLDAKFKTWEKTEVETNYVPTLGKKGAAQKQPAESSGTETFWTAKGVGSHRSSPVHDGVFSSDGSVIALATGSVVTLWDPNTALLRAVLSHPPATEPVLSVAFTGETVASNIPVLVSLTPRRLNVWNLLTCTVSWSVAIDGAVPTCLRADPETDSFALGLVKKIESDDGEKGDEAEEDGKENGEVNGKADKGSEKETRYTYMTDLLVFAAASPVPRTCHRLEGVVRGIAHLPSSACPSGASSSHRTIVLSDFYEVQALGDWASLSQPAEGEKAKKPTEVVIEEAPGRLTNLYGDTALRSAETLAAEAQKVGTGETVGDKAAAVLGQKEKEKSILSFWDGPTFLLPPPTLFGAAYILSQLKPKPPAPPKQSLTADLVFLPPAALENEDEDEVDRMDADDKRSFCYSKEEAESVGPLDMSVLGSELAKIWAGSNEKAK
ncbi:hypothetical protein HDU96_001536 [Phlyctochytrium bullatum]|nr:hypothetical protein HDU96_001536 [Phlyctochytrium bullatum]